MKEQLRVFIASASEGTEVAVAVRDLLAKENIDPHFWDDGTFELSQTYIESLEKELDVADFAVVALTPDDESYSRGKRTRAPRDNVLFELGLFMGRLGRERCYFVHEKEQDLKPHPT